MKKLLLPLLLPLLINLASAQTIIVKGRILGQGLEEMQGVKVINLCNADTATSNKRGFYTIHVARGDSIFFTSSHYSHDIRGVKRVNDNINVILIKRKTADITDITSDAYKKAAREDNKLYGILEKGAEQNGQWNY